MSEFASALARDFAKQRDALPGGTDDRIAALRHQAFATFESLGLPSLRDEDWKYTDLSRIRETAYEALGKKAANASADTLELSELDLPDVSALKAVFVDGRYCARLSNLEPLPSGMSVTQLASLLNSGAPELAPHMSEHDVAFTALNSAFLNDGLVVTLAPNVELSEPLHVVNINTSETQVRLVTARLIIKAGANARGSVVETHTSIDGASGLVNAFTEIEAADGADIAHYRLQYDEPACHHIGNVYTRVGKDAQVTNYSFAFGGGITRVDVNADLIEHGAHVVLDGLFMVDKGQHIDHHTRIRHLAGRTTSSENYRGVADSNGRGVFNGKIFVAENAQKIEALQSSKNLLLSDNAEIDTKPELEIYADDVKCAHGATVGQLDDDADFYLRSRGIDEVTARAMLTFAFAADISDGVKIGSLREWLEKRIVDRTHTSGVNEIESRG